MKIAERQRIGETRIAFLPAALQLSQEFQLVGPVVAQSEQKPQRPPKVAELVHQVDLREIGLAFVADPRTARKPLGQRLAARRSGFVNAPAWAPLGRRAATAQPAFLFQPLERGINLAELGRPEVADTVVELSFEVVAAGRLAQQSEQDVVQAHRHTI